jgi:uncharacterized membrane protein
VAISERDEANGLIHLYRGELARMTTYRLRLDTTTNWAVGTTAATTTLSLGSSSVPHFTFGIPFVLVLLFLWMESTRYCVYELVRQRVRLLEQGFHLEILGGEPIANWRPRLAASMANPDPPITLTQALAVRLRKSYLWLFLIIYTIWLAKIALLGTLPGTARIGSLPGTVVIALVTLQLAVLIAITFRHSAREEG